MRIKDQGCHKYLLNSWDPLREDQEWFYFSLTIDLMIGFLWYRGNYQNRILRSTGDFYVFCKDLVCLKNPKVSIVFVTISTLWFLCKAGALVSGLPKTYKFALITNRILKSLLKTDPWKLFVATLAQIRMYISIYLLTGLSVILHYDNKTWKKH